MKRKKRARTKMKKFAWKIFLSTRKKDTGYKLYETNRYPVVNGICFFLTVIQLGSLHPPNDGTFYFNIVNRKFTSKINVWLLIFGNNFILIYLYFFLFISFQLFYLILFDYFENFSQIKIIKVIFFEWKRKEIKRRYFNDLIS